MSDRERIARVVAYSVCPAVDERWEPKLAKLARTRAAELLKLADELEG